MEKLNILTTAVRLKTFPTDACGRETAAVIIVMFNINIIVRYKNSWTS